MKIIVTTIVLAWAVLSGVWTEAATPLSYQLTVAAGNHDRSNVPVCAVLSEGQQQANLRPVDLAAVKSVKLTDAAGKLLPAQLAAPGLCNQPAAGSGRVVRELHFIVPSLKKGETLKLTAVLSPEAPAAKGFAWQDAPGDHCDLSYDGRPVLRYMYKALDPKNREETYKVYHHVFDPTGKLLVTKGPGALYTHHRGLFFGYCHITFDGGKADTWGCGGGASETHEKFLAQEAGPVMGRHLVSIAWRDGKGKAFLTEQRELTAYNTPGGTLIGFASRLTTNGGKVKLDGNAPHAGFQFRAAREVSDKNAKQTYYLRPDPKAEKGKARASAMNLPWDAMSFVLDGNRYTVVYLDKPTNPKPAEYNERDYGRFGSYFKYELDEGKDLLCNYRVWLQAGEMTVPQAAALSADFVEPMEVK